MRTRTLLYHDVVDDGQWSSSGFAGGDAAIYKFARTAFDEHLDRLTQVGDKPDLALDTPSSNWMLTFDDGGSSALDIIAPALERYGWRGHFFMTTGWLGAPGFLDGAAIRELAARGHIVGSHTAGHPLAMSSLSRAALSEEWSRSVATLADVLGRPPVVASIPGGAYSPAVAETAGEAGIRVLFTSEPTSRPWRVGGVMCIGRFTLWRGMSANAALEFAQGRGLGRFRQRLAWDSKKILKRACGPVYRSVRRRLLARADVTPSPGTASPPPR
jgi:peptidoglycan/xylan/chitin deacetylase (PgdA/CDA1 family)